MNNYSLTLPHSYSKLRPRILDQKYLKKDKFDVVFYSMIHKFDVDLATL